MLKTVIARASLAVFALIFIIAISYGYSTKRIFWPSEWYGYSQGSDAGFDIRSPTRRAISAITFLPKSTFAPITFEEYQQRCGLLDRVSITPSEHIRSYRGVKFCNGAALIGEPLEQSYNYFKTMIDDLYMRFYMENLEIILSSLGFAFAGVIVLLLSWRIIRWVGRGA